MSALPSAADDVLAILFAVAASPAPLPVHHNASPWPRTLHALRRALSPASHHADYISLLLYAAIAADLLLTTDNILLLSPAAADWAAASHPQRLAILGTAVLSHPLASNHWQTARRPGWRLLKHLPNLDALAPPRLRNSPADVARRIGRLSSDLLLSNSPASSITALAAALSTASRVLSPRRRPRTPPLTIQLRFEDSHAIAHTVAASVPHPPGPAFLELAAVADISAPHSLVLDRASVSRTLAAGASPADVFHLLDHTLPSLNRPSEFDVAVRRWNRSLGRIRLHSVTLLETRSASDLDALLRIRRVRRSISRSLSPRTAVVDPRFVSSLRTRLHNDPSFVDLTAPHEPPPSNSVHLYLAARIAHALPDLVPLPWRTPHALLSRLERALSPTQRAFAQASLDAWRRTRSEPPLPNSWLRLDPPRLELLDEPARARTQLCSEAAAAGRTLAFEYLGRDDHAPSLRRAEALRIEWRRAIPYLVAFDLDAEEERTFRIDRITAIRQ